MRSRRGGFTLVEVAVSVGLGALVLGALGWLMLTANRVHSAAGMEMDLTSEALRMFRRTSRDVMASRGMVKFTPAGGAGTVDGLQMKSGMIIVYARREDGSVWRSEYLGVNHVKANEDLLGEGFAYFHIIPLEVGIHVALELERSAAAGTSYGNDSPDKTLELTTVVVPRGW